MQSIRCYQQQVQPCRITVICATDLSVYLIKQLKRSRYRGEHSKTRHLQGSIRWPVWLQNNPYCTVGVVAGPAAVLLIARLQAPEVW